MTKKLQPYMQEGRKKQLGKIGTGRSVVSQRRDMQRFIMMHGFEQKIIRARAGAAAAGGAGAAARFFARRAS